MVFPQEARPRRGKFEQRPPHAPQIGKPIGGREAHRARDHALEVVGQIRTMRPWRLVASHDDTLEDRRQVRPFVGQPPRHAFVQDDAQRVLIARRADRLRILHLLRCEVAGRAEDRARRPDRAVRGLLRDPEVEHLRLNRPVAHLREEDVLRLQIAVDDALVVRRRDGRQDRKRDVDHLLVGQRSRPAQVLRQVLAIQILHDEKRRVALEADVGDVDRVRVPDARRQLGLQQEARARLGDGRESRADDLDRDAFADLDVEALVDGAHSAFAEQTDDPVLAQCGPRRQQPLELPSHAVTTPTPTVHPLVKRKSDADRAKPGRGSRRKPGKLQRGPRMRCIDFPPRKPASSLSHHVAHPRFFESPLAALLRAAHVDDDARHRQGRARERERPLSKPSRPTLSRRQRRG